MAEDVDDPNLTDPTIYTPDTYSPKEPGENKRDKLRGESDKSDQQNKRKIGEHPVSQVEKLLDEPILVPRNPAALIVRVFGLIFLFDITSALIFLVFTFIAGDAGGGILVAASIVLFFKTFVMIVLIVQSAMKWIPESYYITERQLVIRKGFANTDDESFELVNIRHVNVKQDYLSRKMDYGRIDIKLATAGLDEDVKLKDIKNPQHFEKIFRNYLG